MIKSFKAVALGLSLLFANVSVCSAQDLQKGLEAALKGDYATALREWSLLAAQGLANAQYNLGWMYYIGLGIIQDNVYAYMWYNIAASGGDANAVNERDVIAKKMTPSQLEKAQDLASECVKKN